MKAEELIGLSVIDIGSGTTLGAISGLLIDQEERKVVALQIRRGSLSGHRYVAYTDMNSIEHDVATVDSVSSLLDRRDLKSSGVTDHLIDRKIVTEDGRDLGEVKSYSINPGTGEITSVTFAVDKDVLGGLWKSTGECYDVPATLVTTLGESVVVDSSVPDIVGLPRAA